MLEMILLDAVERLVINPRELLSQPPPHRFGECRPAGANTEPDQALPYSVEVGPIVAPREPALNPDRLKRSPRFLRCLDACLLAAIWPEALLVLISVLIVRH